MSSEAPWQLPAVGRFTSDFGPRPAPVPGGSTYHRGIDIAPPMPGQSGVPIRAAADGRVITSRFNTVRGHYVQVRHVDGSVTHYQHLAGPGVPVGRSVAVGEQIGVMGATGTALGNHLHFKTYPPDVNVASDTTDVDPEPFMLARGVNLRTGTVAAPVAPPTATTTKDDDMVNDIIELSTRLLGRAPSTDEILDRLAQTPPAVAADFLAASPAAEPGSVNAAYLDYLGRPVDAPSLGTWTAFPTVKAMRAQLKADAAAGAR